MILYNKNKVKYILYTVFILPPNTMILNYNENPFQATICTFVQMLFKKGERDQFPILQV